MNLEQFKGTHKLIKVIRQALWTVSWGFAVAFNNKKSPKSDVSPF